MTTATAEPGIFTVQVDHRDPGGPEAAARRAIASWASGDFTFQCRYGDVPHIEDVTVGEQDPVTQMTPVTVRVTRAARR